MVEVVEDNILEIIEKRIKQAGVDLQLAALVEEFNYWDWVGRWLKGTRSVDTSNPNSSV